ncbi:unnamed protein product, partial [Cyprideis torosa]
TTPPNPPSPPSPTSATPHLSFPCPPPSAILPCRCLFHQQLLRLIFDCSSVLSARDLNRVFHVPFPFSEIFHLIAKRSGFYELSSSTFDDKVFKKVTISGSKLTRIQPGAFARSSSVL